MTATFDTESGRFIEPSLDAAIERHRGIADSYRDTVPDCDVAREHAQLADWLEELRDRRSGSPASPQERIRELEAEAAYWQQRAKTATQNALQAHEIIEKYQQLTAERQK